MIEEIQIENDVATLRLVGDLLGGPGEEVLHNKVKKLMNDGIRKVILDMEKVYMVNSAGLGLLVALVLIVKSKSGQMIIANLSERIMGLFKSTRLDLILEISEAKQETGTAPANRNSSDR